MKKLILISALIFGTVFMAPPGYCTVTSTISKKIYYGTGASATYAFTFRIFATTDLVLTKVVTATGAQTVLAINTDYTVALSSALPSTGTITLVAGVLPVGTQLVIQRVVPLTQQINISDYSPTPASTWNEAHDRGVMLSQQLQEQLNRVALQNVTQSTQITFPSPVSGQCIGWSGSALANLTCAGGGGGGSGYTPPIDDTQIQAITTASKVNGTAIYNLPGIPAGAGALPTANIPTITNAMLAPITTASTVSGAAITGLASLPLGAGPVPVANGGTGQTTAQLAINALTAVSAATNEYVLTKDTGTGNATFKAVPGSSLIETKAISGTATATFTGLVSGAVYRLLIDVTGNSASTQLYVTVSGTATPQVVNFTISGQNILLMAAGNLSSGSAMADLMFYNKNGYDSYLTKLDGVGIYTGASGASILSIQGSGLWESNAVLSTITVGVTAGTMTGTASLFRVL